MTSVKWWAAAATSDGLSVWGVLLSVVARNMVSNIAGWPGGRMVMQRDEGHHTGWIVRRSLQCLGNVGASDIGVELEYQRGESGGGQEDFLVIWDLAEVTMGSIMISSGT